MSEQTSAAINHRPEIRNLLVRLRDRRRMEWTFDMDKAADEIDRLTSENFVLMASVQTAIEMLESGDYDAERLLAALWPEGHQNGSSSEARS